MPNEVLRKNFDLDKLKRIFCDESLQSSKLFSLVVDQCRNFQLNIDINIVFLNLLHDSLQTEEDWCDSWSKMVANLKVFKNL